ncbi:hypothetical protein MNBD_GAMMA07-809 [hydrothermal vent metagenome]|uniref:CzcB-like barrel-sandwich hybrid domain-containing protein n=1 Tax=hydrothermal vent metagenome TaxID=652676 RepID=A0A3B0XIH8_9ZZZZ
MFRIIKYSLLTVAYLLMFDISALADDIPPIDCMIEPNAIVELSSPVAGVIETLLVDRSDDVKKGQIIGTLNSDIERVAVKTSKERLKLINIENKRAKDLYRDRVITLSDKDKSDNEKKLLELDLQNAEALLDKRKIRSPIDGQVITRYSNPGEFVETEPILKLAQLDPLKIEVVSPISNFGKIIKGMKARIIPEFGVYEDLYAKVIIVDKVIDAASGTFGIRLELENKNYMIPGGLKCKVKFMPYKVPQAFDKKENFEPIVVINTNKIKTPKTKKITKHEEIKVISSGNELLVCASMGPYKKISTVKTLIKKLKHNMFKNNFRIEEKIENRYQINGSIFATYSKTNSEIKAMKVAGVTDVSIVKYKGKYRISLGLYSKKTSAIIRLKSLQAMNYPVSIDVIKKKVKKYWLDMVYVPRSGEQINLLVAKKYQNPCESYIKSNLIM